MSKVTVASMKERLLQPAFEPKTPPAERLSDPIADTPMVVTLDQLRPYEHNPRATQNPKYAELKESIRVRGLDQSPPITRRPGADTYIIRNGGNTRLAILNELYRETSDEKYFRIHCLFRPWDQVRGEIIALTGHLAENDLHGQLMFIERAIGIDTAKTLYEQEEGTKLSLRELSRKLTDDGYPISHAHISRMQDTIRYLLPAIPGLLYSGLGVDRVMKLLALRKTAQQSWERHYQEQDQNLDFSTLYQDVLAQFEGDAEEFLFSRFQDELIHHLQKPLNLSYERVLLDITQNQDQLRRSTPVLDIPQNALMQPEAMAGQPQLPPADSPGQQSTEQPPQPPIAPEPSGQGGAAPGRQQPAPARQPKATPPPLEQMTQEERQARIDGHVVSPVTTSARVLQMKQKLAELDGETLPDFGANALVAIPVQAGGLHPISDLWYIEREIDEPTMLRRHIAQLAREIATSVDAPGEFVDVEGGIGFRYLRPEDEVEVTATALHTLTLLQSLSGSLAIALNMLQEQPALQVDALADFEFAAGLGQILMGQPLSKDRKPDDAGRLSDGALVKLFRIVRLARRLIDLEIREFDETTPPTNS